MGKIFSVLVLMVLAVCWFALLWFALPISWQDYRPLTLLLLYVLPPLVAWVGWLFLKHRWHQRRLREAANREAQRKAEGEAAQQAAKAKYEVEMTARRFSCQCRGMAVAGMTVEASENLFAPKGRIPLEPLTSAPMIPGPATHPLISQQFQASVKEVLGTLYEEVPASMAFPLYVAVPSDMNYGEAVRGIEETAKALMGEYGAQQPVPLDWKTPQVIALPEAATPADALLAVFAQRPDLAGMIALAFDSPYTRKPLPENIEIDCIDVAGLFPEGLPTYGVVALCCTSSRLADILSNIADYKPQPSQAEALTPYWEKSEPPPGDLSLLCATDLETRQVLLDSPLLASIHHGAEISLDPGARPLEVTQRYQSLLERCLINGGLIEVPFSFTETPQEIADSAPSDEAPESKPPVIGWLAHNAGITGSLPSGKRLAPLGAALDYFRIDVNPIREASNIPAILGDWGIARPWATLAAAVTQTAEKQLPTLCTFFRNDEAAACLTIPG